MTNKPALDDLRLKLGMIISHASGGHLSEPGDIDRSTNDICVEISRHKNDIWEQAQESARAAHSLMAAKVAELESENARLRERLNGARAVSKRLGHDLLREEADAALASFGTEWEPLRNVAARAGAQSAAWLASRARELQSRGLVESRWIGNDRTSSFKVWRLAVRAVDQ